jgi:hypothetical protein
MLETEGKNWKFNKILGVGNWKNMSKGELKNVSEIELELRTCLTLGISEINQYNGQKFTKK